MVAASIFFSPPDFGLMAVTNFKMCIVTYHTHTYITGIKHFCVLNNCKHANGAKL